jgi:hypothetical protein
MACSDMRSVAVNGLVLLKSLYDADAGFDLGLTLFLDGLAAFITRHP